ncbi:SCO family protein [Stutzerimonas frequens]|uniref:SCO family protein n=1 Tax=Stutzerimonas frequens TaxID=2968969 RepID=UPI00190CB489|nr:SCO family protein [Stutzerimonas frequens]MBK3757377.1 SCO family protein [Stutzerimonas frequens]MBK3871989.1 SCO family protein [Stutzerimonas frequens]MBK3910324.1 SCO family protein [Stutzerimonas frequens]MBK3928107.1 SCO family protein [Stutzerimonas frequens]
MTTRLLLAAWLLMLGLIAHADEPFDPFAAAGIDARPGAQVPLDTRFTDDSGTPVTLGDLLDGRPAVLVPVYYNCPNVCGTQLASLFNLLSAVPFELGRDYVLIVYSFDPRETPADARAERDRLARRWPRLAGSDAVHLLTGPETSSGRVSEALGFRYRWDAQIDEYAHASAVAALSPAGVLVQWLYGLGYQPNDLRLALTEAGEGQVGDFSDQLLLLCYHYNPRTGGYDNWVIGALQIAGTGTAALLLGFIGLSLWRERCKREAGDE